MKCGVFKSRVIMQRLLNIALLALFVRSTNAVVNVNIRGAQHMEAPPMMNDHIMNPKLVLRQAPAEEALQTNWGQLFLTAGIVALIVVGIGGGLVFALNKGAEAAAGSADAENLSAGEQAVAFREAEQVAQAKKSEGYQKMFKLVTQKVAQEVGPKLSKGVAVKNCIDSRMTQFQSRAKEFLLSEIKSTTADVCQEMGAPEAMMLLDVNAAVESNFPPAAILVAGVLSPTVLNLQSIHHLIQLLAVGLPIFCLCVAALYIDWAAPCAIPTIFPWLFTQTGLALCLVIGHAALMMKVSMGKGRLAAKAKELHDKHKSTDGMDKDEAAALNLRDEAVDNTILLQEALVIEHGVRQSLWNQIVGLATFLWIITTLWNLFLICRYTFVPGIIAFHPKAAHSGDFCGAWMTVLVLRINILLAVLFFFFNIITIFQWICDNLIESSGFQQSMINKAREIDRNGAGLPVVELLMKAFLLRGKSDTLNSRLSVVQSQKAALEKEKAQVDAEVAALSSEIDGAANVEKAFLEEAKAKGGTVAEHAESLGGHSDLAFARALGKEELQKRADEMRKQTQEELEKLWQAIQEALKNAQESETYKMLQAKAEEVKMQIEAKMNEAWNTVNDPKFQENCWNAVNDAAKQAEDLANQAKDAIKDPEAMKKAQQAMQEAMKQAQEAAAEVAKVASDPAERAKLQAKAEQAMAEARKQAEEMANQVTNPEFQKQMQEAAMKAVDQAQATATLAVQQAAAAAFDPEQIEELKKKAQEKLEEAEKAFEEAKNDPQLQKLAEEAKKAAAQMQAEAEKTQKEFEEAKKQVSEELEKFQAAQK